MKKTITILIALIGFGISVLLCGNSINSALTDTEKHTNCSAKIYREDYKIKYSNSCDYDLKVWYVYEYRTCWNTPNGKECSKWIKSTTYHGNLSANNPNGTLLELQKSSGIEYRMYELDYE